MMAAVLAASWREGSSWFRSFVGLATIALIARAPSVVVALASFVLATAALSAGVSRPGVRTWLHDGLAQAGLAFLVVELAQDLMPQLGSSGDVVSGWITRYVARVSGLEIRQSLTPLGGAPVLLASLYLLWRWRLVGGAGRLAAAVAVPAAWLATTAFVTLETTEAPLAVFARGAMLGVAWLALAVSIDAALPDRVAPPVSLRRRGGAMRRTLTAAACLIAAAAGVSAVGTALIGPPAGRKIVVHNRGGLDWDRPTFGRFGAFSGGMFGLLPVYCRAEGYDFDVIDKDRIGPEDLKGVQILVLINSPKAWPEAERQAVLDFLAGGGSLLVLGDHTDVFGLMRGFNTLLGDFGIRFRFDSAYKTPRGLARLPGRSSRRGRVGLGLRESLGGRWRLAGTGRMGQAALDGSLRLLRRRRPRELRRQLPGQLPP